MTSAHFTAISKGKTPEFYEGALVIRIRLTTTRLLSSTPRSHPLHPFVQCSCSIADNQLPRLRTYALALVSALVASMSAPQIALADLKLCNSTESRVGVAIGYQDKEGWATEGWWNIASQTCETLLKGDVPSRFIYVHAVDYDRGGEWVGTNFMCTNDKSFAIRGVQDCGDRGYKRTGFFEVDTGDAKDWTIRLTDPDEGTNKTDATQPTR